MKSKKIIIYTKNIVVFTVFFVFLFPIKWCSYGFDGTNSNVFVYSPTSEGLWENITGEWFSIVDFNKSFTKELSRSIISTQEGEWTNNKLVVSGELFTNNGYNKTFYVTKWTLLFPIERNSLEGILMSKHYLTIYDLYLSPIIYGRYSDDE